MTVVSVPDAVVLLENFLLHQDAPCKLQDFDDDN
jgi:hypothetical protein